MSTHLTLADVRLMHGAVCIDILDDGSIVAADPAPESKPAISLPDAITAVLKDYDCKAVRDQFGQIVSLRSGEISVDATDVLESIGATARAYEQQTTRHRQGYRRTALYGIDAKSQLAVILEREGEWDSKRRFGEERKRYYLVDLRTGTRCLVKHGKIRGEIRAVPDLARSGVLGAFRSLTGTSRSEGTRILKSGLPPFPAN